MENATRDSNENYVALLSHGVNHSKETSRYDFFAPKRRWARVALVVTIFTVVLAISYISTSLGKSDNSPQPAVDSTTFLSWKHRVDLASILPEATENVEEYLDAFNTFVLKHSKLYTTVEEKAKRFEIFIRNALFVKNHNAANQSYTLEMNEFSDLTNDEFRNLHFTGYRTTDRNLLKAKAAADMDWSLLDVDPSSLPRTVNWVSRGCVTQIQDQRQCGACWAFSAAGAIEGSYCIKHRRLVSLSVQQMVDCAGRQGNEGCDGGEMNAAFEYVMDHGGLCAAREYPYIADEGRCRDRCEPLVTITGFADVPPRSAKALRASVALRGPTTVAIQADQTPFQFYRSGVFDGTCGTALNHGVLVVGYGTEKDQDYWLIKNSWGRGWGDAGYIKISASTESTSGKCGILLEPSYAVV